MRGGPAARLLGPQPRARNPWQAASRLAGAFAPEARLLAVLLLLVLLDAGLGLLSPFLIGRAVDTMAGPGAVATGILAGFVLALLATQAGDALVSMGQGWLQAGLTRRIIQALRRRLFGKLQKLPVSFFDTHTHGDLMSRLTNDIDNVSSTLGQSTASLLSSGLMIVGSLVLMLCLSPLLTAASLITVPLVFLLTGSIAGRTRKAFQEQQATLGRLNGHIEETLSGAAVVRAFGREEAVLEQFSAANLSLRDVGIRAQIWSGALMPFMNVISNLGFVAVAGVGGVLAIQGSVTVGIIAAFLGYSRQFSRPLNDLASTFNTLQTALAGAERVFAVLDEAEEAPDPPGALEWTRPRGEVVFDRVGFAYDNGHPVLKDVSFTAPPGSRTALVGPTGAGKTTIASLLTRFYDPTDGAIFLDGTDLRAYTRDSVRRAVGIVLQDPYLFAGTVRENLKYGRLDATDAEMEAAAARADASGFIARLPQGYDTVLSEGGSSLSQGQRQLLSIARAFLTDPALLILDEATSSVDTRTEIRIQEALGRLMAGRTSFVIAHRLGTIRGADTILVVDGGQIVERGSHDELMTARGLYRRLYDGLLGYTDDGGAP